MVQYLRNYHQGMSSGPQRKSRVNRKLIWLTSKIQCNLFLCRDIRECIMSIFCSLIREDGNIFHFQSTVKILESASQLPYRHMWRRQFCCKEEVLIQYIKRERKTYYDYTKAMQYIIKTTEIVVATCQACYNEFKKKEVIVCQQQNHRQLQKHRILQNWNYIG